MSRIIRFYNLRAQQLVTKSPSAEVSEIGVEVMSPVTHEVRAEELGAEVMSIVPRSAEVYEVAVEAASIKQPEIELLFMAMEGVFPSTKTVASNLSLTLSGSNTIKYGTTSNLALSFSGSTKWAIRHGSNLSLTFSGHFKSRPWKQHNSTLAIITGGHFNAYVPFKFDLSLKFRPPSYPRTVLSLAPVVYYDFESIDGNVIENKGTLGAVSNAIAFGSPTFVAEGAGQNDDSSGHVAFDGVDDYLNIPTNAQLNLGGPYSNRSFEFWIKLDGDNTRRTIFHSGNDVRGIHIFNISNRITAGVYNYTNYDSNFQKFVTANNLSLNSWYHIVFTHSVANAEIKIYVNAQLVETASPVYKLYQHIGPITIGARRNSARIPGSTLPIPSNPTDFLKAGIDFSIYNRTLTANEVDRIFNASKYTYYGYANEPAPLTLTPTVNFYPSFKVIKQFGVALTITPATQVGISKAFIQSNLSLTLSPGLDNTPKVIASLSPSLSLIGSSDWKHHKDSNCPLTLEINHYPKSSYWQHESIASLSFSPVFRAVYRVSPNTSGMALYFGGKHKQTVLFDAGTQFLWNVEGSLVFESEFVWNVGEPPVYFYQVDGKCIIPECETVGVGSDCEEPQTFSQLVTARTVGEVCEALKTTLLAYPHTWPILSIKRFSRPISNIEDQALQDQGEGENCNYFETIDHCDVLECLEYCVEPLSAVKIGAFVTVVEIFQEVQSTLSLSLSGRTRNDYRYSLPLLSLTLAPASVAIASNRTNASSIELTLGGSSKATSTNWKHKSKAPIRIAGTSGFTSPRWTKKSRLPLRVSANNSMTQRKIASVDASITISGKFSYTRRKFGVPSNASLQIIPTFNARSSYYEYASEASLSFGGSSASIGSGYQHTSSLSLMTSGSSSVRPKVLFHPAFFLQGSSTVTMLPIGRPALNLTLGGSSLSTSSRWDHTSNLTITIDQTSEYSSSDQGEFSIEIGAYVDLPYFVLSDNSIQDDSDFDFLEDSNITTACTPCESLPILINFKHNMFYSNPIYNFFKRNNIAIVDSGSLQYHQPTATWRHSGYWKESNAVQNEEWKTIFELSCVSTNGPEDLSGTFWKLALWFKKKNLTNNQDAETRLVQLIKSEATCENGPLDLRLLMNALSGELESGGLAAYSQTIFNDDIGLFNTPGWQGRQIQLQATSLELRNSQQYFNYENAFPNF